MMKIEFVVLFIIMLLNDAISNAGSVVSNDCIKKNNGLENRWEEEVME
jgi:hypothetical protein